MCWMYDGEFKGPRDTKMSGEVTVADWRQVWRRSLSFAADLTASCDAMSDSGAGITYVSVCPCVEVSRGVEVMRRELGGFRTSETTLNLGCRCQRSGLSTR